MEVAKFLKEEKKRSKEVKKKILSMKLETVRVVMAVNC